jgi:predicted small secreted protein
MSAARESGNLRACASLEHDMQKEAVMKRLAAVFLMLIYTTLVGCNTMHGLGKDIERGGEKLRGEAREQQQR